MFYNVLPDESEGLKGLPMIQAVRLCTSYAREIYKNCIYAIDQENERKWIVPKDFGENDFFRIVGHTPISWVTFSLYNHGPRTAVEPQERSFRTSYFLK
jgi:hypothetical protein